MSTRLSLDRFEGKGKQIAVLLTDDGETLNLPKSILPPGVKPGDVLTLTLEHDPSQPGRSPTRPARFRTGWRNATLGEISNCENVSVCNALVALLFAGLAFTAAPALDRGAIVRAAGGADSPRSRSSTSARGTRF